MNRQTIVEALVLGVRVGLIFGVCGITIGGITVVLLNPRFVDNLSQFLLFFCTLPLTLSILFILAEALALSLCFSLFRRKVVGRNFLALLYGLNGGFFLFIIGVFLLLFLRASSDLKILPTFLNLLAMVVLAMITGVLIRSGWLKWGPQKIPTGFLPRNSAFIGLLVFSLIIALSSYLYRSLSPGPKFAKTSVVIIGLDGFSWNVINHLLKEGQLPQMKELMEEGAYGDLISLEPIISPAIWTSIATGTMPEKHGIIRFESLQSQLEYKRIWEILEEVKEEKIGVFRWYMTWPPQKSRGFIVPCWIARGPETWPPELNYINFPKKRASKLSKISLLPLYLIKGIQGGMRLSTLLYHFYTRIFVIIHSHNSLKCIPKQMKEETLRDWDIFLGLLQKYQPNFAAILFTQGDYLSHHYWKYFEHKYFQNLSPQEVREFGDVIPEYYRLADQILGEIKDRLNEESLLVIVSDHGFTRGSSMKEWMFTLKTEELLKMIKIPREVINDVIIENRVFLQVIEPDERKRYEYFNWLYQTLEEAKIKNGGKRCFLLKDYKLHQKTEGQRRVEFPTLCIEVNPEIESVQGLIVDFLQGELPLSRLVHSKPTFSGEHIREGILIMRGKGLKRGYQVSRASVLDVTPTILALKGVSLGWDMDGRVLEEALDPIFIQDHPISYGRSYSLHPLPATKEPLELNEETLQRLRALGYVQ